MDNSSLGKEKLLNKPLNEFGKRFLEEMFARYHDKTTNEFHDSNFEPTEHIILTDKEYEFVDKKVETTLGLLFFNRFTLEKTGIIKSTGYWNEPLNSHGMEDLMDIIVGLLIGDIITAQQYGNFIDNRDKLNFWSEAPLSASISPTLVKPMHDVNKRKDELFEQYKDELNSDDPVEQVMACSKIEKELMQMVRANLKDDTGRNMYESGTVNLDNNYKVINVMRGAVFNPSTKRYDIVKSSLMEGIKKGDKPAFSNSITAGAYPSAVGTAEAGAMAKIILALLQSERVDTDPKSDCGTKSTIPITITSKNKRYVLFRYINENGKNVYLDFKNIKNYIGKTVDMYSPQGCLNKSICSKCSGKVYQNLNATNVGLLATPFTQKLLNLKLKSKHDLSVSAAVIPLEKTFLNRNDHAYIDRGFLKNKNIMKLYIPKMLEEMNGFFREETMVYCMGIFPVKFFNANDAELLSTLMIVPSMLEFNIYSDIQETEEFYIITYDPDSLVCSMAIQQNVLNVQFFINQIYLFSKTPQIPYNLLTDLIFKCFELNNVDLETPSIIYELLARRVCRSGNKSFASVYGKNINVDQMSYEKKRFRETVHEAGVLQSIVFQDANTGMNKGLASTLNGLEPEDTPLEKIIRS